MGLSIWQILLILAVVLIFFGPSRLPGLGKSLGEAIRGFKKGIDDDEIDVTGSEKDKIAATEETEVNMKAEKAKAADPEKS